jgi:hypothetical protein
MAYEHPTPRLAPVEAAISVLFCPIDDACDPFSIPMANVTSPSSDFRTRPLGMLFGGKTGDGLDYTRELFSGYSRCPSMRDRSSAR